MRANLIATAATAAVVLFVAGCGKEVKTPLVTPEPSCVVSIDSKSYEFSWSAVENASAYSYKLVAEDGTVAKEDAACSGTQTSVSGLAAGVEYTFSVTAVAADGGSDADSEEASLKFKAVGIPGSAITDAGACLTWKADAESYSYRLVAKDAPQTDLLKEDGLTETSLTFKGLSAATSYIAYVNDVPYLFTTAEASPAGKPWVAVVFEYKEFAGKNTIYCHNVPNSIAKDYFTTTENVNVIGEGWATESQLAYYIVSDYEEHKPGVYANTAVHRFNNNGAGWKAGDKLFYAAVGEDKNGNDVLNWFWVEMPANPGDDIKILDTKASNR